ENWGYKRLADKGKDESFGEMKHAEELIERILYLEGVPNMQRLFSVKVGETVPEQLQAELATEKDAITRLAAGIEQCRKTDEGSRLLLERILADEEEHADWLETQLELIRQLGEGLYLNAQVNAQIPGVADLDLTGQRGRQHDGRPQRRELDDVAAVVAQQGGQRDLEADAGPALPGRALGLGPPDGEGEEHAVRHQPGDR